MLIEVSGGSLYIMNERKPIETVVVKVSMADLFPPESRWKEVNGRMVPSSDFYEMEPRAKEIRDICVKLTTHFARLLWDKTLVGQADRAAIEAEMQSCGEQLAELGVVPNMNLRRKQETYRRKPTVFAEYVAGQLLPYSGYQPRSEESTSPLSEEFEIDEGLVDISEGLPKALENYYVDGWIVKNAIDFLDCEPEVRAAVFASA